MKILFSCTSTAQFMNWAIFLLPSSCTGQTYYTVHELGIRGAWFMNWAISQIGRNIYIFISQNVPYRHYWKHNIVCQRVIILTTTRNVNVEVYSLKSLWVQQTLQLTPLVLKLSLIWSHLLWGEFSAFSAADAIHNFSNFRSTRYQSLLGGQRRHGMRGFAKHLYTFINFIDHRELVNFPCATLVWEIVRRTNRLGTRRLCFRNVHLEAPL